MLNDIQGKLKQFTVIQCLCACMGFIVVSVIFRMLHIPQTVMRIYWTLGLTTVLCGDLLRQDIEPVNRIIIGAAYAMRVVIVYVNEYLNNIISSLMHIGDDNVFINASIQFYRKTPGFSYGSRQFPKLMAGMYNIFDEDPLIGTLVLVCLFMTGVCAFYKLMKESGLSLKTRIIGLAVLCFAPYGIVYSVLFLREQINFCFITLSFLFFARHVRSHRLGELLAAMVLSLPAIYMHWGYMPVLAGYVVYFFAIFKATQEKRTMFRLMKLVLLAIFIAGAYAMISQSGRIKYFIQAGNFVDGLALTFEKYMGLGGESQYLKDMRIEHTWQLFVYTPLRTLYFFLSPLPMNWRDWRDVMSFLLDSTLYLGALAAYIYSLFRHRSTAVHMAFWILAFTGATFCWATVTAGAAIRHRTCLLALVLFIVLTVWKNRRNGEGIS